MYKDFIHFYKKYRKKEYSKEMIENAYKEWQYLTEKYFNFFTKEELISALKQMWTQLNTETGNLDSKNQWEEFLGCLNYYSDRMNINRWCRLQLLIGNAYSH